MRRKSKRIGTLDFETDPFKYENVPCPFAACVFFGDDDYSVLWEADSKRDFVTRVVALLRKLPECVLYAHNGGRFDYHYMLEFANPGTIQIRAGRVTQFKIGNVTLKDSFPLMPFALSVYKKDKIDYKKLKKNRRRFHRDEIVSYMVQDCRSLFELVTGFRDIVGEKDTIGSAAFFQMRALKIPIQSMNETHDAVFRPFYFGGRVEAFKRGVIDGPHDYIDLNSAYPYAMKQRHAHGAEYRRVSKLPKSPDKLGPCFVRGRFKSQGALPLREEDGSLSFPHGEFDFCATGWEVVAGMQLGILSPVRIDDVWIPLGFITFSEYVERFYSLRQLAKKTGDLVKQLAYKFLLNSGYGKFAQNPRDFREYKLAPYGEYVRGFDWESDFGSLSLWSRPSYKGFGFFDVATGASITGYVRAMLMRAITKSRGVIYCDTDALICKSATVPLGDKLGEWKLEGKVKRTAIAGKKLYGVEWTKPVDGERYKIASKGARLDWSHLLRLCSGKSIIWKNEAPTFTIHGAHFIKRRIRAT